LEEAFPLWGKLERGYVNAGSYREEKGVCDCREVSDCSMKQECG